MNLRLIFSLWFLLTIIGASELEYLKSLDDFVAYQISFKPGDQLLEKEEDAHNWISMMSADDEEYRCLLPSIEYRSKTRIESYSGPSPSELLQSLSTENTCSYRKDSYWMYEICHGRYVLQYHNNKETNVRTEYYLGNYAKVKADAEAEKFDQLNPPTRKFEKEVAPYFSVSYSHGTNCDLTNKPRQTTILYTCDEEHLSYIYSVNEVISCQYEVVVLTKRLCAHPSFQKTPKKEHDIRCFAAVGKDSKPKSLLAMERESTSQFFQEFSKIGKNEISNEKISLSEFLKSEKGKNNFDQLNNILDLLKLATVKNKENKEIKVTKSLPKQVSSLPSNIEKLIKHFWEGKACLTGGSGWWKYEICHGRSVIQFHEEVGKERQSILLGVFHKDIHKQWIDENPHKAVKMNGDKVYQIENLYTEGEICPETGGHRSCEVRIRCLEDNNKKSAKVSIYLVEPGLCFYVLVIESHMFCSGMQNMDKYGMLPEMSKIENSIIDEPKKVSVDELQDSVQIIHQENLENVVNPNPHLFKAYKLTEKNKDYSVFAGQDQTNEKTGLLDLTKFTINTQLESLIESDVLEEVMQNLANLEGVALVKHLKLNSDKTKKEKNKENVDKKKVIYHNQN